MLGTLTWVLGSAVGMAAAAGTSIKDSADLHLLKADAGTLIESGQAKGTLPGTVEVKLKIHVFTASSSFRINARGGGAIWGHGSGKLKIGKGPYDSFGGRLVVTGGSGRYRHASGTGGLYGTLDRANDAMTVQVSGDLHT